MGGLFDILGVGHRGLVAGRFSMNVASQNISNVNTPGYTRRTSLLGPVIPPPPGGGGVNVEGVHRFVNKYVEGRLLLGIGAKEEAEVVLMPLRRAQAVIGSEDGGTDPLSELQELFGSIRRLQVAPQDGALRLEVLNSARSLADRLNAAAKGVEDAQNEADQHVRDYVREASDLMHKIAELNAKIGGSTWEQVPDLRDRRNMYLQRLAKIMDIRVVEDDLGKVTVIGSGGINLVQGEVTGDLEAVTGSNGFAEVHFVDTNGSHHDITGAIRGGAMGGLLDLRDDTLPDMMSQLDQFAYDVATAFNGVHSSGFGLDGVTGRDLFLQPATVQGAARAIAIDPAVDGNPDAVAAAQDPAALPGDNSNLLALSALEEQTVANGGTNTLLEAYSRIVGHVGTEVENVQREQEVRDDHLAQLESMRDEVSGVSIDEELVDMTKYQKAYEASARVIQTANQMLDTLLNLKRD